MAPNKIETNVCKVYISMPFTQTEIRSHKLAIHQYLARLLRKIPQDTIIVKELIYSHTSGYSGEKYKVIIEFRLTGIEIIWRLSGVEIRKQRFNITQSADLGCVWRESNTAVNSRDLKKIAGYRIQYKAKMAELEREIANLREENANLREENMHLQYAPGGPGYIGAKEHYENVQKIQQLDLCH